MERKLHELAAEKKQAEDELFKTNPAAALTEFNYSRVAAANEMAADDTPRDIDATAKRVVDLLCGSERLSSSTIGKAVLEKAALGRARKGS